MSEVFFIGDTHFGHRGLLKYEARAFQTIEEHDEELVRRWNAAVGPRDRVYVLGDFAFGKRNIPIAGRLNGLKTLIMGNHDTYASADYLAHFHSLRGAVEYSGMIFTHIPVHPCQLKRYWANVHGHLHSEIVPGPGRYLCVSAEHTNLTPIPYDEVISRLNEIDAAQK